MAEKKLFWIYKKGVFGTGKNAKAYGDEISSKDVGSDERLKAFIKAGKIGEKLGAVDTKTKDENSRLVEENKKLKEQLKKGNEDVITEYESKIEALNNEIAELKKK
jgi:hypothetical protein